MGGPLFWLLMLFIAALCGSLGARLAGRPYGVGCLGSIALGFIGAALGGWIARLLDLPRLLEINLGGGHTFPTVYAVMGSAVFVALLTLVQGRGRRDD